MPDDMKIHFEATLKAVRRMRHFPPKQTAYTEFDGLTGSSIGAPAALAIWHLFHPHLRTERIVATGSIGNDCKIGIVGDVNEKCLTADKHGLNFVYPKSNTDLDDRCRRDCDTASVGEIHELIDIA